MRNTNTCIRKRGDRLGLGSFDLRRHFADGLADRLARVEQHRFKIQVALNPAHHVVRDHAFVPQVENCALLGIQHFRADAAILRRPALIDLRVVVGRSGGEMIVRNVARDLLVRIRIAGAHLRAR
jgi:hypothetical protein